MNDVSPEPRTAALGDALARVAADPALRRSAGEAARTYVRPRFGVDQYVSSITDLYDRLLATKGFA